MGGEPTADIFLRAGSPRRAVPASISLRVAAAWLSHYSQYTPRGGFCGVTAPNR